MKPMYQIIINKKTLTMTSEELDAIYDLLLAHNTEESYQLLKQIEDQRFHQNLKKLDSPDYGLAQDYIEGQDE